MRNNCFLLKFNGTKRPRQRNCRESYSINTKGSGERNAKRITASAGRDVYLICNVVKII